MKKLIYIVILLSTHFLNAQILQQDNFVVENGLPVFSKMFIRLNGIKSISGSYMTKAENDYMKTSPEFVYYKFNQAGELIFEYKTLLGDTLFILYVYDERGNLIIQRNADKFGFTSMHYRYDDKNRMVLIETRTCSNIGQDRKTYYPDESMIKTTQKFSYQDLDELSFKKIYLNQSDMAYQEAFYYLNKQEKIVEYMIYQKSGYGKTSVKNTYDEMGKILTKTIEVISLSTINKDYQYEYDAKGNFYAINYFENGRQIMNYQYVYDGDGKFLKAIISQDVNTKFMTIVKYDEYVFH